MTKLPILLVAFSFVSSLTASAQTPAPFTFRFAIPFGPHSIGFRVVQQSDPSRPFSLSGDSESTVARPLQTLIWYPAKTSGSKPMTLGDFELLVRTETDFAHPTDSGKAQQFVESFMASTENLPTVSIEGASTESGKYPLIIYAPSLNAPASENIELCEYLASEGFVVVASPSLGAHSRSMTVDNDGASAQAADISFLIDHAKQFEDVNSNRIAIIGYSWGGVGALIAAQRDPAIRALISMDGSFRYSLPPTFARSQLAIPFLLFTRGETPLLPQTDGNDASAQAGKALETQLQGPLVQARLLAISHIQFSTLYQRSERFRHEGMQFVPHGYTLEDGTLSYAWMARYTVEFLDAFLKGLPSSKDFLERNPSRNGVPAGLLQTSFRIVAPSPTV
jgi:dienelactone hydrolase